MEPQAVAGEKRAVSHLGLLTVLAVPVALGVETGLRRLLFPADFDEVRDALRETLAFPAWGCVGLTLLAGIIAVTLVRPRFDARADLEERGSTRELRTRTQGVFVASSVSQIPAVLSTFLWTLGAPFAPVIASVAVSTTFVAWHVWGRRSARPRA